VLVFCFAEIDDHLILSAEYSVGTLRNLFMIDRNE